MGARLPGMAECICRYEPEGGHCDRRVHDHECPVHGRSRAGSGGGVSRGGGGTAATCAAPLGRESQRIEGLTLAELRARSLQSPMGSRIETDIIEYMHRMENRLRLLEQLVDSEPEVRERYTALLVKWELERG